MSKSYSVAEARRQLPTLLDEVEHGGTAQITRRGRPIAVLVPIEEYRRAMGMQGKFSESYAAWRASVEATDLELPEGFFEDLRDRSVGREVDL